VKGIYHLLV